MTWVIPLIGAALSVAGGVSAANNAEEAAEREEEAARMQARQDEAQTQEEIRREQLSNQEVNKQDLIAAAASGLEVSGSVEDELARTKKEQQKELEWLAQAGRSRTAATRARGSNAAATTRAGGKTALWSGVAGGVAGAGQSYDTYANS